MKYIYMVFAILFCLSFTAPSSANDETQNNEQAPNKLFENMFRMPSLVDCGPPEMIQKMINDTRKNLWPKVTVSSSDLIICFNKDLQHYMSTLTQAHGQW